MAGVEKEASVGRNDERKEKKFCSLLADWREVWMGRKEREDNEEDQQKQNIKEERRKKRGGQKEGEKEAEPMRKVRDKEQRREKRKEETDRKTLLKHRENGRKRKTGTPQTTWDRLTKIHLTHC